MDGVKSYTFTKLARKHNDRTDLPKFLRIQYYRQRKIDANFIQWQSVRKDKAMLQHKRKQQEWCLLVGKSRSCVSAVWRKGTFLFRCLCRGERVGNTDNLTKQTTELRAHNIWYLSSLREVLDYSTLLENNWIWYNFFRKYCSHLSLELELMYGLSVRFYHNMARSPATHTATAFHQKDISQTNRKTSKLCAVRIYCLVYSYR